MTHITTHDATLANGLRVIVCPEITAPVVNVTVMYRVGSHDERRGKTGLAHLFEHLMFDNAAPGLEKHYDIYCAKAGGSNNAYTTFDYTNYHIDLPAHQVELGFWLESQRMRSFQISEHALQTQRSVVVEEINQNVFNQPYGIWRSALQELAYHPDSSYSWDVYGSADDVSGTTMEDARSFFEQFYQPSNAVLCVSGDITVEKSMALARQYFGDIPSQGPPQNRTIFSATSRKIGVHTTIVDSVPMPATFLSLHVAGFLERDPLDAEIATTILGSGRSSILYNALVSDKRIASSVGAYVDRRAHSSLITMYAYAAKESVSADELAHAMIEAIKTYTLRPERMDAALNLLRTAHAAELQRVSGIADTVAWSTLFWNNPEYVNGALEKYKQVPLDTVQSLLHKCSDVSQIVRLDVVPKPSSGVS